MWKSEKSGKVQKVIILKCYYKRKPQGRKLSSLPETVSGFRDRNEEDPLEKDEDGILTARPLDELSLPPVDVANAPA